MNMDLKNESALKSYLLGDLNPDEQERIEQRLMIDSEVFKELHRIEDELIDDYLEGSLSDRERERFENFFLAAPERKQKLSFARSLKRYVAAHRPKKDPWALWSKSVQLFWPTRNPALKWALAASLALVVGGGSWSTVQISRLQAALGQEQTGARESQRLLREKQNQNSKLATDLENEKARNSRFEQEIADLKKTQKPGLSLLAREIQPIVAFVTLTPMRRSDNNKEIIVTPGEGLVHLDLIMERFTYPRYQVMLQRAEGDGFRTLIESPIQGQFSGLSVSAELLTRGNYVLRLSGVTADGEIKNLGSYSFRAITQ